MPKPICYIKDLQKEIEDLKKTLRDIRSRFICIGGPLNDNVLKFDNKQREFIYNISEEIKYKLDE